MRRVWIAFVLLVAVGAAKRAEAVITGWDHASVYRTSDAAWAESAADDEEDGAADEESVWDDRAKRLPPLFWYEYSAERRSRFFMFMMLYWEARNPERAYRAVFPLYYQRRNFERGTSTWISPLFYWRTTPHTRAGYVPPVYVELGKDVTRVGTPPLFWYGRTGEDVTSYVFPLYFYNRLDGFRTLATPVGGAWGTQDDWQGFVGPYFWHTRETRKGTARAFGVAPLFYRRTNPDGASTTVTPLSVYEWTDSDHHFLVTPVGGYSRRGPQLTGVWGPFVRWHNESHSSWYLFPAAWYTHKYGHYKSFGLLTGYYSRTEAGHVYTGFIPLFAYARRPGFHSFVSLPYWDRRTENERSTTLIPVFHWSRVGERRELTTLVGGFRTHPGYQRWMWGLVYHRRDERAKALENVVFPFYFDARSRTSRTTVIPPYYRYRDNLRFSEGIAGLWSHTHELGVTTTWVMPLFWNRIDRYNKTQSFWTPLGGTWRQETPRHFRTLLLTFYLERGRSKKTTSLLPLFWYDWDHGRQTVVVPPVFTSRSENKLTVGAVPLFYYHRRPFRTTLISPGLFYFRDGDRRDTMLFPVFASRVTPERATGYLGLYLWGHNRKDKLDFYRMLFPVYYQRRWTVNGNRGPENVILFPGLLRYWTAGRSVNVLPGFGWATRYDRDTGERIASAGLVGPLYWRRAPHVASTAFVPLFFHHRREDRTTWVVPPLLTVHTKDHEGAVNVVGPFVDVVRDESRYTFLFPLFRYSRNGENASFVSLPFLWWLKNGQNTRGFVGVGYWNSETGTRVWPGYVRTQQRDERGDIYRSAEVAFPFYWHYETPTKDVLVVPPYYRVKREDGSRLVGIAPLYSQEDRPRGKSWSILGDFVGYERKGRHRRLTVLFGFHIPLKSAASEEARRSADEDVAPTLATYTRSARIAAPSAAY